MKRNLLGIYDFGSRHWVGDGFHVRNYFPSNELGLQVSPFLLFDYAGPTEFPAGNHRHGVDRHPHRGFETVTLAFQGEIEHGDSSGAHGIIGPDEVQWMTAGSGVVHEEKQSEAFAQRGGALEMIQLWVNLPKAHKMTAPKYQTLSRDEIPVVELPGGAGLVRVIAGGFEGTTGSAETFTPVVLWDVRLQPGGKAKFSIPSGLNANVFARKGEIKLEGQTVQEAQLATLSQEGEEFEISTDEGASVVILGGEPIDEPTVFHGPFVMNTFEEIREAVADYQAGRMG